MFKLVVVVVLMVAVLVGCGGDNANTTIFTKSINPVEILSTLTVGQQASFKITGENLSLDNRIEVSDCAELIITSYTSSKMEFHCEPTKAGKKDVRVIEPDGNVYFTQNVNFFCPKGQLANRDNVCFVPEPKWEIKQSASSGLWLKTVFCAECILGEQGVSYSYELGGLASFGVSFGPLYSFGSFGSDTQQSNEYAYSMAGDYTITLTLYDALNQEVDFKKNVTVKEQSRIVVSNYQPSIHDVVTVSLVNFYDDVKEIIWTVISSIEGVANSVSKRASNVDWQYWFDKPEAKTITATLLNNQQEAIGVLGITVDVNCPLGTRQNQLACVEAPLRMSRVTPSSLVVSARTKVTVFSDELLPTQAIFEIDGVFCEQFERTAHSISQWCTANLDGATQKNITLKYAKGVELGKSLALSMVIIDVPFVIRPLNDTGINFCTNGKIGFADCASMTSYWLSLQQDAQTGRDALAAKGLLITKVGGGDGGFDFSKVSATGSILPADASVWDCVVDNHTGLMWENKTNDGGLRDKNKQFVWYSSNAATNGGHVINATLAPQSTESYVAEINQARLCGFNNWRMPEAEELISLAHLGKSAITIDDVYFLHTQPSRYWTATPNVSGGRSAWVINFAGAGSDMHYSGQYAYVRLVR